MTRPISLRPASRTVLFAILGVLACIWASGTVAFAQRGARHFGGVTHVRPLHVSVAPNFPRRPIRPVRPILPIFVPPGFWYFGGPSFGFEPWLGFSSMWWQNCGPYFGCGYQYSPLPLYYYIYGGEETDRVQLYLKDGTVYNVTDYWLVDGLLHFMAVEEGGAKFAEHVIDFDQLDLQKTIDVNTRRGFRFVLRNEPIDQYLLDHPEMGVPSAPPPRAPAGEKQ